MACSFRIRPASDQKRNRLLLNHVDHIVIGIPVNQLVVGINARQGRLLVDDNHKDLVFVGEFLFFQIQRFLLTPRLRFLSVTNTNSKNLTVRAARRIYGILSPPLQSPPDCYGIGFGGCSVVNLASFRVARERSMYCTRVPFVVIELTSRIRLAKGCIRRVRIASAGAVIGLIVLYGTLSRQPAEAQTFSVFYSFQGIPDHQKVGDGGNPWAGLVRDPQGNLYGTTYDGGRQTDGNGGYGTVFKVDTSGTETVLHRFTNEADGGYPWWAGVVLDLKGGDLYGTASSGGTYGNGVVYKLDKSGKEAVLYNFSGGTDGGVPYGGVIRDAAGNLYGTTSMGGDLNCINENDQLGCGTVFKLDECGNETVLHSFTATNGDGESPWFGVAEDAQGNLYGMTVMGGDLSCTLFDGYPGCGIVFKLDAAGSETILHTFTGPDGAGPLGPVTMDAAGNLYGPAGFGPNNSGTIFKIDTSGNYSLLFSFPSPPQDGSEPVGRLLLHSTGNIYGVTCCGGTNDYGVLFSLTLAGEQTVLHKFTGGADDGAAPYSGVIFGPEKSLYGTTQYGGSGAGVVYKFTP